MDRLLQLAEQGIAELVTLQAGALARPLPATPAQA
jgi:hypothetical protein